jgi:hypothetical protein
VTHLPECAKTFTNGDNQPKNPAIPSGCGDVHVASESDVADGFTASLMSPLGSTATDCDPPCQQHHPPCQQDNPRTQGECGDVPAAAGFLVCSSDAPAAASVKTLGFAATAKRLHSQPETPVRRGGCGDAPAAAEFDVAAGSSRCLTSALGSPNSGSPLGQSGSAPVAVGFLGAAILHNPPQVATGASFFTANNPPQFATGTSCNPPQRPPGEAITAKKKILQTEGESTL